MSVGSRLALFVLLLLGAPLLARAEPLLHQILTNGPTDKRINIMFLSEGYTEEELGEFPNHAAKVLNSLLSLQPYREYAGYFNAFTIAVPSAESGSDHPARGIFRDTYFNSSYDSYGLQRLITIPPNDRDAAYDNGQGKVDALLQKLLPDYDITILIVNDEEYGGSGGTTPITSHHANSADIIIHELGHSFAGLGDEYALPFPGYPDVEEPNTTTQTNRALIKWNPWILPETPIPTPDLDTTHIGLFEGAHYHATGWYRPKFACKMRDLRFVFCEVCVETLVKSIYGVLDPVENFSPAVTNVALLPSTSLLFQVRTLFPASHNLDVQWLTNGVPVAGASATSFIVAGRDFPLGIHEVRAEISDSTTLVRSDPEDLLMNSVTWRVVVQPEPLALTAAVEPGQALVTFALTGPPHQDFVIESSTNLLDWAPVISNRLGEQPFEFTETLGAAPGFRFFRAVGRPSP